MYTSGYIKHEVCFVQMRFVNKELSARQGTQTSFSTTNSGVYPYILENKEMGLGTFIQLDQYVMMPYETIVFSRGLCLFLTSCWDFMHEVKMVLNVFRIETDSP